VAVCCMMDIDDLCMIIYFQGVEFFDEKLNALFMAWLLDHGRKPLLAYYSV